MSIKTCDHLIENLWLLDFGTCLHIQRYNFMQKIGNQFKYGDSSRENLPVSYLDGEYNLICGLARSLILLLLYWVKFPEFARNCFHTFWTVLKARYTILNLCLTES